jgi:hypothetical protein
VRHVRAHAGLLIPYLKKEVGTEDFPYQHEAQKDRSCWSQWGQSWCMRSLFLEGRTVTRPICSVATHMRFLRPFLPSVQGLNPTTVSCAAKQASIQQQLIDTLS